MEKSYEERLIGHLHRLRAEMRMEQGGMVVDGMRRKRSYGSDRLGESAVRAVSLFNECLGARECASAQQISPLLYTD